jgi:hypothetical protein
MGSIVSFTARGTLTRKAEADVIAKVYVEHESGMFRISETVKNIGSTGKKKIYEYYKTYKNKTRSDQTSLDNLRAEYDEKDELIEWTLKQQGRTELSENTVSGKTPEQVRILKEIHEAKNGSKRRNWDEEIASLEKQQIKLKKEINQLFQKLENTKADFNNLCHMVVNKVDALLAVYHSAAYATHQKTKLPPEMNFPFSPPTFRLLSQYGIIDAGGDNYLTGGGDTAIGTRHALTEAKKDEVDYTGLFDDENTKGLI